jgi:hypothetical protein
VFCPTWYAMPNKTCPNCCSLQIVFSAQPDMSQLLQSAHGMQSPTRHVPNCCSPQIFVQCATRHVPLLQSANHVQSRTLYAAHNQTCSHCEQLHKCPQLKHSSTVSAVLWPYNSCFTSTFPNIQFPSIPAPYPVASSSDLIFHSPNIQRLNPTPSCESIEHGRTCLPLPPPPYVRALSHKFQSLFLGHT